MQIKFIFACSILVPLTSATYIYRRPIAYSKLDPNPEVSRVSERHDHRASNVKNENSKTAPQHENVVQPNVLTPGVPVYTPLYLVPVREQSGHNSGNGGGFGAFGSLAIPGLHVNLGGGNGFGGSLSATGGFSGGYGPGHAAAHAGGFAGALVTPVHYGYPVHHVAGTGGFATVGAHQGFTPFYAGANGIHHIKASEVPASASGVVNLSPTGPILGGISPQKNDYQEKQPEVLFEVSSYQQEGEDFEQSVLPPGFHHPGFIASSAGRLGYPVIMASPEQLQDISLRQNPNPFAQFFQRPFQLLQMFIRPNQGNSSKQPEKPETEKPVVESPVAGKPGPEKPVEAKPSSQKPSASQHHASVNKVQESKQNVSASTNHPKKPSGNGKCLELNN